jgi:hypothetical protein
VAKRTQPRRTTGEKGRPMSGTKDMSGSISKNDKGGIETRPDIKGHIIIEGRKYWPSGWLKENDHGKWYSLSAQPADQPAPRRAAEQADDADVLF